MLKWNMARQMQAKRDEAHCDLRKCTPSGQFLACLDQSKLHVSNLFPVLPATYFCCLMS